MAGINDYTLDVILKAKEEGMAAFAAMNARLAEMVAATNLANAAMERMNSRGAEHSRMLRNIEQDTFQVVNATERMADALERKLTPALNNSNNASRNAENGFRGAQSGLMAFVQGAIPGGQTAGNIAIAVAAAAAALAPFTAELEASLVMLGAWVVGAAAFVSVIALAVGPILALTALIVGLGISATGGQKALDNLAPAQTKAAAAAETHENALQALARAQLAYDTKPTAMNLLKLQQAHEHVADAADKQAQATQALTEAQINANGAFATFDQHTEALTKTLGTAAIPMMATWINWIDTLIPRVQELALKMFDWYGQRLPSLVGIANQAVNAGLAGVERFATAWAGFFDRTLARAPEFGSIINGAFNRVIDGAIGLMLNLEALSNWFVARLPTLGANANSVLGNIGVVIQALGAGLGAFVDWIIAHWPAINAAFNASWDAFKQGWAAVQPILAQFGQNLKDLAPLFQYIEQHADNLKVIYWALGAAVGLVVAALEGLFVILVVVAGGIVVLGDAIHGSLDALHTAADAIGGWWNGAKDVVGKATNSIVVDQGRTGQSATDAAATVGAATGGMSRDWMKTAGPGTGSIQESTDKINVAIAGVRGPSSTTATQTTADTASMSGDWGTLAANSESSATRIQRANTEQGKSNDNLQLNYHSNLGTIWAYMGQFAGGIGTLNQNIATGYLSTQIQVGKTLSAGANDLAIFGREHLGWVTGLLGNNKNLENGYTSLKKVASGAWTDMGIAYGFLANLHKDHSQRIGDENLFLELSHTNLWHNVEQTATNIRKDWEGQVGAILIGGQAIIHFFQNNLGPAFSVLGTAVANWQAAVRSQFAAAVNAAQTMVSDIVGVVNGFIRAVDQIPGVKIPQIVFNLQTTRVDASAGPAGLRPLAQGGVLPGYAPGRDSVPALLSPGEGVLTPQTTRALGGATAIDALNSKFQHFATGGVVSGSSIAAWLPNAGTMVQGPGGSFSHQHLNAWDFMVPMGSPLYAGVSGTVNPFSNPGGYGNAIQFAMDQGGYVILGHLMRALASGHVAAGSLIGLTNNTGFSTGPHLHFEVRGSALTPGGSGTGLSAAMVIDPLVNAALDLAHTAMGKVGWLHGLGDNVLNQLGDKAKALGSGSFDRGGQLPPGSSFVYNGTGRSENVSTGDTMDKVIAVLQSIDTRLATLSGQPRLSGQLATQRNG